MTEIGSLTVATTAAGLARRVLHGQLRVQNLGRPSQPQPAATNEPAAVAAALTASTIGAALGAATLAASSYAASGSRNL